MIQRAATHIGKEELLYSRLRESIEQSVQNSINTGYFDNPEIQAKNPDHALQRVCLDQFFDKFSEDLISKRGFEASFASNTNILQKCGISSERIEGTKRMLVEWRDRPAIRKSFSEYL